MKHSEMLYKMAKEMKKRGFSPYLSNGDCRCFLGLDNYKSDNLIPYLEQVIGTENFLSGVLMRTGWTDKSCTDDAVAALNIAGDLAAAEGQ